MKRRREKEQDKGNAEWLNVQYVGKREETETGTPCWHVQRLITVAAVSTDVGLRGSCQSVCVHVYARGSVRDRVWQWSEGYLVMTAADTMNPFLYLSIQCSRSPPAHHSSCRSFSLFLKFYPPLSSYLLLSQYFTVWQDAHLLLSLCGCEQQMDVAVYSVHPWKAPPHHFFPLVIRQWAIKQVKRKGRDERMIPQSYFN